QRGRAAGLDGRRGNPDEQPPDRTARPVPAHPGATRQRRPAAGISGHRQPLSRFGCTNTGPATCGPGALGRSKRRGTARIGPRPGQNLTGTPFSATRVTDGYAPDHVPQSSILGGAMRIGLVVDSACDLPLEYLQRNEVTILPITVRIGEAVLADHRNEEATLEFLHAHVAERGAEAETTPYTVQQIRELFLERLVIVYDYVFCMTLTKSRSPIHDNAQQASFAILNDYKAARAAAGNTTPFALRVIDTQNLFSAQGITAVEAIRLRAAGEGAPKIRARLENLALHTHGYLVPPDLYYLRARARKKGDRSVGLLSAAL